MNFKFKKIFFIFLGPPVEDANVLKYAKRWISDGHRFTDSSRKSDPKKPKRLSKKDIEENERNDIFYSSTTLY